MPVAPLVSLIASVIRPKFPDENPVEQIEHLDAELC